MRAWLRMAVLAAGIVVAAGLWAPSPTGAQSNTTAWKETGPELRVYDIKALFTRTPIYNFAKVQGTDSAAMSRSSGLSEGGGGGGGSLYSESVREDPNYSGDDDSRAKHLQDLIEHVVKVKEPWEGAGGRGTIIFALSRGLMFVSTTEDGHKQIEMLLHQLLPGDKRNVFIDIEVVDLDRTVLDEGLVGFMAATDKDKAALKKAMRKRHFSAVLSGTEGQVLSSEKGGQQDYIGGVTPVVAEQSVGFTSTVGSVAEGLAAKVQASLTSDGLKATFDFRLLLQRVVGNRPGVIQGATNYRVAEAVVDLPHTVRDAQAGTVLLPLDTPTVVAGGTVPQSLLTGNAADTGEAEVFYVVTVRSPVAAAKK